MIIDQIFDRDYQAGRAELNGGIRLLASHLALAFANAFRVLNRIEYNAPWLERRRTTKRA
jgi:hypothetical protein